MKAGTVLKRIAAGLGALLLLLVAAAVIIPLVVDVDKYRPRIVQAANERLNGNLELGKLSLSLWGQLRVEIAGLLLKDSQGRPVVSARDAYFHVPFSSILQGAPILTFRAQKPEVHVVKNRDGTLNVLSLMKPEPEAPPSQGAPSAPPGEKKKEELTLPGIATRARLGVEFRDALLSYVDEKEGSRTRLEDLNLVLRDLSLSRPTELEAWANLNTSAPLALKGAIRVDGRAQPELAAGKIEQITASLRANLDDLEISLPGAFEKKKGVPANGELIVRSSAREARIERLLMKFLNAEVIGSGTVSNLSATGAATGAAAGDATQPIVSFTLKSNEIALAPWSEVLPSLRPYGLTGIASFDAGMNGPSDKLGYQANLVMKEMTAKLPRFKVAPRMEAVVNITTDQIESFSFSMKAPGNSLNAKGRLVSFQKPRIDLDITSPGMDLDQLIEFPPATPPPAQAAAAPNAGVPPKGGAPMASAPSQPGASQGTNADYDALLAPLRENAIAAATHAQANLSIQSLKAYGVPMSAVAARFSLKELVAAVDSFSMKLWDGAIQAKGSANLKTQTPTYQFSSQVDGLDLRKAIASQVKMLSHTIYGKADFQIEGTGSSFNPDPAKVNLDAKGKMKIAQASFATIDVGRMAGEAINQAVDRAAQKVPQLKGKNLKLGPARESRYDSVSSDFTIKGGRFSAPNFAAKAEPNQGIDVRGDTKVGLVDQSLAARWELVDTYNLLHARDLSVEVAGAKIEHVLAQGDQPVKFPVTIGCTLSAPCYSYTETPQALANVAAANVQQQLEGRAKSELQKRAEEKARGFLKKLPTATQEKAKAAVKDLRKQLFGN